VHLAVGCPPGAVKDFLRCANPVVVCPASHLWIEWGEQGCLVATSVVVNNLSHFCQVTLLRGFARFEEGLEAETGVTLAHRILAHGEAKKVKTDIRFVFVERVGNAGFGRLEVQSHRF